MRPSQLLIAGPNCWNCPIYPAGALSLPRPPPHPIAGGPCGGAMVPFFRKCPALPLARLLISARSAESRQWGFERKSPTALAAEPHPSRQISRLAAATTIPVTNAARHENSTRSFNTPVMAASPHAAHVGVIPPQPLTHSPPLAESRRLSA